MKKIAYDLLAVLLLFVLCLVMIATAEAAHLQPERAYQQQWCDQADGVTEYRLPDKTRVDCLTEKHAEFDFAQKWAESIGQALYYGQQTGRTPGVVLILEKATDRRYLKRLRSVADQVGIRVWTMGPEEAVDAD